MEKNFYEAYSTRCSIDKEGNESVKIIEDLSLFTKRQKPTYNDVDMDEIEREMEKFLNGYDDDNTNTDDEYDILNKYAGKEERKEEEPKKKEDSSEALRVENKRLREENEKLRKEVEIISKNTDELKEDLVKISKIVKNLLR